jgi:hypothetical protein
VPRLAYHSTLAQIVQERARFGIEATVPDPAPVVDPRDRLNRDRAGRPGLLVSSNWRVTFNRRHKLPI